MRPDLLVLVLLVPALAAADYDGHTKLRATAATWPDDSLVADLAAGDTLDAEGDLRLNLRFERDALRFQAAYQFIGLYGDRVEYSRLIADTSPLFPQRLPDDQWRLMDLTRVIHDEGKSAWLHRLDRLWAGYAGDRTVVRIGRQALSWGNGLFWSPMDLVNPFDPAAVDTEYKAGDDMLYGQFLRDNGDDLQAAVVLRRDLFTGDVDEQTTTAAVKYHGFAGETEYDLLLGRQYGDDVAGAGLARSVGGAVWRGDAVLTRTGQRDYAQFLTNLSYSWVSGGRNMSGSLEYYYNGFGLDGGDYDADRLLARPALVERLVRGDLYTLGRHYLGASVLVEMSPLWTLTPTALVNAGDGSALIQLISQTSVADEIVLLGSLNVPVGPAGTEFGGIEAGVDGPVLGLDASLFVQLAWYFQ